KVTAAEVAATRMDNMKGSMEALSGSVETLAISIGQQLIPFLTDVVNNLTAALDWFMSLDAGMQQTIVTIAGVTGGVLLAFGAFIKITQAMAAARATILAITGATGLLTAATNAQGAAQGASVASMIASKVAMVAQTAAMVATKTAMAVATAAQWAWNAAMNANPIGLIVAAIAALVAGIIWFFTQTEIGQQIWQGFMTWLQEAWANISS